MGRDTCTAVSGYSVLDVWQQDRPKRHYASTRLTDVGTSRIVRRQCSTRLHDVHVGRPHSSQKKMATLSAVLLAVCVF